MDDFRNEQEEEIEPHEVRHNPMDDFGADEDRYHEGSDEDNLSLHGFHTDEEEDEGDLI